MTPRSWYGTIPRPSPNEPPATPARFPSPRDRGLLVNGQLISSLSIESYEWEGAQNTVGITTLAIRPQPKAVLRLHVRRLFAFLPTPRIRIPAEQQEALQAILKRHLSEWPQA